MACRDAAWFAITVVVVMLSLTVPPTWSMALLCLLGMLASAVDKAVSMMRPGPRLPISASAPAVDAPAPAAVAVALAPAAVAARRNMRSKPGSSSTSSLSSGFKYDVYLNFRHLDTHDGITVHLYTQLVEAGIRVFNDRYDLTPGKEIGLELREALVRSRISIAILSKNYAFSEFCLNELVQMWECRKTNGQIIFPIFYDVSPMDVRHQAGDFGKPFALHHIDRVDSNTIDTWREVLRQIGRLRGFSPRDLNGHEGELVKRVVAHVAQLLKRDDQVVTDKLVGIDRHVQGMMRKLGVAYSEGQAVEVRGEEVRVVGIWGAPGVGKTTLAKVVFNKMRKLFDASCFLEDISLEGVPFSRRLLIADLQKQKPAPLECSREGIEEIASLCRNVKVLIVLDDVDEDEQIRALAGKLTWFGPGSRIIVTTDKRNVLNAFDIGAFDRGTVKDYKVEPMSDDHALQLFRKHAFEGDAPEGVSEYDSLCKDIVKAIGGLPSAIVDHASSLRRNMNMDIWKSTLDLLQKHPKDRPAASQVSHAGGSEHSVIQRVQ
ncbi:TMV resistance protein N-like [Syzygium oleosum]|uniref:TMV resistance protein N-like n=1 Tax=Syzygium oleosum TaxID=219896 RepID=UPI0011D2476F|nr:TMV resistance protein N-like [Syzygium oleosum]